MSGPIRLLTRASDIDADIVAANVRLSHKGDRPRDVLIAIRHGTTIYVRNCHLERPARGKACRKKRLIVERISNEFRAHYWGKGPNHEYTGVDVRRFEKTTFRVHRNPFRITKPMEVRVNTTESEFNTWWRRYYYPGKDIQSVAGSDSKRTPRELFIDKFYDRHATRWTPPKFKKLCKLYGADVPSMCATMRIPWRVYQWWEVIYRDNPTVTPTRILTVMGPAFLLMDFLQAAKTGAKSPFIFPLSALAELPEQPALPNEEDSNDDLTQGS